MSHFAFWQDAILELQCHFHKSAQFDPSISVTSEDKGLVLTPDAVNARYVILHNGKNDTLYKIKSKDPRFWSKANLEKKGFETLGHEYYLVYELDTTRSQEYANIPGLKRGNQTTIPFFATWPELMG